MRPGADQRGGNELRTTVSALLSLAQVFEQEVAVTALVIALEADENDVPAPLDPFEEVGDRPLRPVGPLQVLPVARGQPGLLPRGVVGALVAHPAGGQVLVVRLHLREERPGRAEIGVVLLDEPAEPARRSPDDADERRVVDVDEVVPERGGVGLLDGTTSRYARLGSPSENVVTPLFRSSRSAPVPRVDVRTEIEGSVGASGLDPDRFYITVGTVT